MKPILYILAFVCFLPSFALADSTVSGHFRANFVRAGVFEVPTNDFVASDVELDTYKNSTAISSSSRKPRAVRRQAVRSAVVGSLSGTVRSYPGRFIRSTLGTLSHPIN